MTDYTQGVVGFFPRQASIVRKPVLSRICKISELNQCLLNSIKTLVIRSQTKDEGKTKSVTEKRCMPLFQSGLK